MAKVYFNGVDVYTNYGVRLDSSSLTALMTPPSLKDWISNDVRSEDGVQYVTSTTPAIDKREITLTFWMIAPDETTFLTNYAALCKIFESGTIDIKTEHQDGVIYHCLYQSCSQFTQYERSFASFGLKLIEPNPSDRD